MQKNKSENNDTKIAVGVGIGMLAALSAGAYYLYGTKEGAKKRVKIRGWVLKAKGEVMEKLENLKEVNEETYNNIITTITNKYKGVKSINPEEVESLVTDLKKHWKSIKKHIDGAGSQSAKKKTVTKKK
jgi:hypothetical protein